MTKIILTDVDGVLVSWIKGFDKIMLAHGHKRLIENEYNLSKAFGVDKSVIDDVAHKYVTSEEFSELPPILGSKKAVRFLHEEHGYVFHCITTVGSAPETHSLRLKNLHDLFGKTAIHDLHCVNHNEDKKQILKNYHGSGLHWIEDHAENSIMGLDLGLKSIIMHQEWNKEFQHEEITRVYNWVDICKILTSTPSK